MFFTSENAYQMKQDFMKCINYAGKDGGLFTCSVRDNEFGDFLLFKKRTTFQLPLKTAVSHSGVQLSSSCEVMDSSVWVLGPDIIIAKDGRAINPNESNFAWISHLDCRSTGQAVTAVPISIFRPLGSSGLHQLIDAIGSIMGHNFYPAIFALGSGVNALYYAQLITYQFFMVCPDHCKTLLLPRMSG